MLMGKFSENETAHIPINRENINRIYQIKKTAIEH